MIFASKPTISTRLRTVSCHTLQAWLRPMIDDTKPKRGICSIEGHTIQMTLGKGIDPCQWALSSSFDIFRPGFCHDGF